MYMLIVMWLGTAPAGVGTGFYETKSSEEACNTRAAEVLNDELRKAAIRKDRNLPFVHCALIS